VPSVNTNVIPIQNITDPAQLRLISFNRFQVRPVPFSSLLTLESPSLREYQFGNTGGHASGVRVGIKK
jgi:hypothetical protein